METNEIYLNPLKEAQQIFYQGSAEILLNHKTLIYAENNGYCLTASSHYLCTHFCNIKSINFKINQVLLRIFIRQYLH